MQTKVKNIFETLQRYGDIAFGFNIERGIFSLIFSYLISMQGSTNSSPLVLTSCLKNSSFQISVLCITIKMVEVANL